MNRIDVLDAMEYIDTKIIDEAEEYKGIRKKGKLLKWIAVAACLCVVIGGVMALRLPYDNAGIGTIAVQAKELGLEEYQFGVALPEIIYSDNNKAILYDYRGIYVYNYIGEKLVGFVDFRRIGMDQIQGDNPTVLDVSTDGKFVRFYNNSKKYLYKVEENDYVEVDSYDDNIEVLQPMKYLYFGEENAISEHQITYIGEDGAYLAVEIDLANHENEIPKYKNLYILRKDGDTLHKYYMFN